MRSSGKSPTMPSGKRMPLTACSTTSSISSAVMPFSRTPGGTASLAWLCTRIGSGTSTAEDACGLWRLNRREKIPIASPFQGKQHYVPPILRILQENVKPVHETGRLVPLLGWHVFAPYYEERHPCV